METKTEVRSRYRTAFKRYSLHDAQLRRLKAELPDIVDSAAIHGINAQSRVVSEAERDYKALRLEYAKRLLDD